jgi:hypothetical protein
VADTTGILNFALYYPRHRVRAAPGASGRSTNSQDQKPASTAPEKGGQVITWEEQGMKVTLPAGWHKGELKSGVETFWNLKGPDGASLSIDVLDDQESVDVEDAFRKDYDFRLKRQQSGELDEVRYLELNGVKGLLSRWTEADARDRSLHLLWQGWRRYKGKRQFVSITLSGSIKGSD